MFKDSLLSSQYKKTVNPRSHIWRYTSTASATTPVWDTSKRSPTFGGKLSFGREIFPWGKQNWVIYQRETFSGAKRDGKSSYVSFIRSETRYGAKKDRKVDLNRAILRKKLVSFNNTRVKARSAGHTQNSGWCPSGTTLALGAPSGCRHYTWLALLADRAHPIYILAYFKILAFLLAIQRIITSFEDAEITNVILIFLIGIRLFTVVSNLYNRWRAVVFRVGQNFALNCSYPFVHLISL